MRKKIFFSVIRLINCILVVSLVFGPTSVGFGDVMAAESVLSEAIQSGIELYKAGDYEAAMEKLSKASGMAPGNHAVAVYLGLAKLRLGNQVAAIREWKRYTTLHSKGLDRIGGELSALILLENREQAAKAIQNEASIGSETGRPDTIAVTYFHNLGSRTIDPLQKGFHALLVNDLSKVPQLSLVERGRLQALLDELHLSETGLVDRESALRAGKLLRAGRVVTGTYMDLTETALRVDAGVHDTENRSQVGSILVGGETKKFYDVEKELVFRILATLGYDHRKLPKTLRDDLEHHETKNAKAFEHFSRGLDNFDRGDFEKAKKEFQGALEEDENFGLATWYLKMLPFGVLTIGAIIAGVESWAPLVKGAVVTSEMAVATAAASSGSGSSAGAWILGGLVGVGVIAGGAWALKESQTLDICGTWQVSVVSSTCPPSQSNCTLVVTEQGISGGTCRSPIRNWVIPPDNVTGCPTIPTGSETFSAAGATIDAEIKKDGIDSEVRENDGCLHTLRARK